MSKTFKATSGVEVVINLAPWQDAKALKKAIQQQIVASGINPEKVDGILGLIPVLMQVDGSDMFEAALAPCLERCLRDGEKITEKTWDKKGARVDYYDIIEACVMENLNPLVQGLFSRLVQLTGANKLKPEAQKSA